MSSPPSAGTVAQSLPDGKPAARVSVSPGMIWGLEPRPFASPPQNLPDPLLAFDVTEKKREIFEQVRETIRHSAQYTKHGRKPWTQITVRLPIQSNDTTHEQDLAVIWELMRESTRENGVKENLSGDVTWHFYDFLQWIGIDEENTKPCDKYVHPVQYETGSVQRKRLEKRLAKEGPSEDLERQLAKMDAKKKDDSYRWAGYEECYVSFKKKQPRKAKFSELQLTVKIRTYVLGSGDPKEHHGYMLVSNNNLKDMDPSTSIYALMKRTGAIF